MIESDRKPSRRTLAWVIGFDRSRPPAPATLPGAPLRVLTVPNLIDALRLLIVPLFLVVALNSTDGRSLGAALLFGLCAGLDYWDGLLARLTGQYSRLGAAIDPIIDRLLVLSGAIVCWHFELLPRWALAVLIVRELLVLLAAVVLRARAIAPQISWVGRIGSGLTMLAITTALFDVGAAPALLYCGVAAAVTSLLLYGRDALRLMAASRSDPYPQAKP